jgi:hypothetical protein
MYTMGEKEAGGLAQNLFFFDFLNKTKKIHSSENKDQKYLAIHMRIFYI